MNKVAVKILLPVPLVVLLGTAILKVIFSVIAGHPFDTVKVKIQTMPHLYSSNVIKTFFKIVKREGVRTDLFAIYFFQGHNRLVLWHDKSHPWCWSH